MSKNLSSILVFSVLSFVIGVLVTYMFLKLSSGPLDTFAIDPVYDVNQDGRPDFTSKACVAKNGSIKVFVDGYTTFKACPKGYTLVYLRDYYSLAREEGVYPTVTPTPVPTVVRPYVTPTVYPTVRPTPTVTRVP